MTDVIEQQTDNQATEEKGTVQSRFPMMSPFQLFNLCLGIVGIQFAWSMQIALSSRVLEPLGADPFLFGLIWCAGPVTGLLVQPIVGAISDRTWTKIGRRRPFFLIGAVLGAIALIIFPMSPTLLFAVFTIWIIDACVNISQGPYRALVPDNVNPAQHAIANGYINFAYGVGSVIALGTAPVLKFFNIEMTITQQYIMSAIALILFIVYTSLTIKEFKPVKKETQTQEKETLFDAFKVFLKSNKEIHKLCGAQFLMWIGIMCMFIYLTPFVVHNIYNLPDLSTKQYKQIEKSYAANITPEQVESVKPVTTQYIKLLKEGKKDEIKTLLAANNISNFDEELTKENSAATYKKFALMKQLDHEATNTSQLAFVALNLVSLILSIPLGYLCLKFGKKFVLTASLLFMIGAFSFAPVIATPAGVITMMAFAGVGWATILSIPYSILCDYIPSGNEGSIMGIFNIFIAGPQLISATLIGWIISQHPTNTVLGSSHNWSIAFISGAICISVAIAALKFVKEKKNSSTELNACCAGH